MTPRFLPPARRVHLPPRLGDEARVAASGLLSVLGEAPAHIGLAALADVVELPARTYAKHQRNRLTRLG